MRTTRPHFVVLLVTYLVGCAAPLSNRPALVCVCPLNELSQTELAESTSRAEGGDAEAMRRLADHYADIGSLGAYVAWSLRLAETGDKEAQEEMVCWHVRLDRKNGTSTSSALVSKWGNPPRC